ncbi:uncharacterized protein TNCV_4970391 [Trichonephila clavipes]|nr:uncharacterized protein TNCV_4970391 [Trichonephila clavipes]
MNTLGTSLARLLVLIVEKRAKADCNPVRVQPLDVNCFDNLAEYDHVVQVLFYEPCYTKTLVTDHVILNQAQVTGMTLELAPPLLTTTPHRRENVSALDRFNVQCCPTRRNFNGTGLELMI